MNKFSEEYSMLTVNKMYKRLNQLVKVNVQTEDEVEFLEWVVELLDSLYETKSKAKQYDIRVASLSALSLILEDAINNSEVGRLRRQDLWNTINKALN